MYVLGIALAVTVVDQLTKLAVQQDMVLHESIPVIPGFFHITYILNRGAAFGILENQQWFFLVIALVLSCCMACSASSCRRTPGSMADSACF